MKKLSYLIVLALILGLVLTGCTFLSNIGQAPTTTEQSGISYLTKHPAWDPDVTELMAGQNKNVGTVSVWNDLQENEETGELENYLCVKYELSEDVIAEGWFLTETHLAVVTNPDNFPMTKKDNPIPGHFTYGNDKLGEYDIEGNLTGGAESYQECIKISDIEEADCDIPVYIAAHAVVCKLVEEQVPQPGDLGTWPLMTDGEPPEEVGKVTVAIDEAGENLVVNFDPVDPWTLTGTTLSVNSLPQTGLEPYTIPLADLEVECGDTLSITTSADVYKLGVEYVNEEINLVANGSFEVPEVTHSAKWDAFANGTASLGWTVEWVNPDDVMGKGGPETANLEIHKGVIGPACEGAQYTELDSDWYGPDIPPNGKPGDPNIEPASVKIYQDITTTVGVKYELSFAFSSRAEDTQDSKIGVYWGESEVKQVTKSGEFGWTYYSCDVTATTDSSTLKFVDLGFSDSYGTLLDAVTLSPYVQEEETASGSATFEVTIPCMTIYVPECETAWGYGIGFPGENWATYFDYTIQCGMEIEEIWPEYGTLSVAFEDLSLGSGNDWDYNDWVVDIDTLAIFHSFSEGRRLKKMEFTFHPEVKIAGYTHVMHLAADTFKCDGTYELSRNGESVETGNYNDETGLDVVLVPNTGSPPLEVVLTINFDPGDDFSFPEWNENRYHGENLFYDPYIVVDQTDEEIHKGDVRMLTVPINWQWPATDGNAIWNVYPKVIEGDPPTDPPTFCPEWWTP